MEQSGAAAAAIRVEIYMVEEKVNYAFKLSSEIDGYVVC